MAQRSRSIETKERTAPGDGRGKSKRPPKYWTPPETKRYVHPRRCKICGRKTYYKPCLACAVAKMHLVHPLPVEAGDEGERLELALAPEVAAAAAELRRRKGDLGLAGLE